MKIRISRYSAIIIAIAGFLAFGQEYPFSDNFFDPVQTDLQWSLLPADSMAMVTAGGVCTITNRHKSLSSGGIAYHTFSSKTTVFTASCIITRSADSIVAGMWLCLSIPASGGSVTGYVAQLGKGGYVSLIKQGSTGASQIFGAQYHRIGSSDTLKVSKQGNTFLVFCDGVFLGSVTDNTAPIASGDFGLFLQGNSSATFDDALVTNQFTPGSFPVCVTDSFAGTAIDKRWLLNPSQYFSEHNGVLSITVPASAGAYGETRMSIDTFVSRTIVSWRSGDSVPLYGFYLNGQPDSTGVTPMAQFGISGMRRGRAFLSSDDSIILKAGQIIRGKAILVSGAVDTVFFKDTIDVRRAPGSAYLVMYVNGTVFDSLALARITFAIAGAGVFAWGSQSSGQNIFVDYFHVGPTLQECVSTGSVRPVAQRGSPSLRLHSAINATLFDPLGRVAGKMDAAPQRRTPGYYIISKGNSTIIIRR